jgi:hypothetical protein
MGHLGRRFEDSACYKLETNVTGSGPMASKAVAPAEEIWHVHKWLVPRDLFQLRSATHAQILTELCEQCQVSLSIAMSSVLHALPF